MPPTRTTKEIIASLEKEIEVLKLEIDTLEDLIKSANRDRDNALVIARGYHDQWAEADRNCHKLAEENALNSAVAAMLRAKNEQLLMDLEREGKDHGDGC